MASNLPLSPHPVASSNKSVFLIYAVCLSGVNGGCSLSSLDAGSGAVTRKNIASHTAAGGREHMTDMHLPLELPPQEWFTPFCSGSVSQSKSPGLTSQGCSFELDTKETFFLKIWVNLPSWPWPRSGLCLPLQSNLMPFFPTSIGSRHAHRSKGA